MPNPNLKEKIISRLGQIAWLSALTFVMSIIAGTTIYVFAAFTEPTAAPAGSDQDFAENILGANNADNDYDSSLVAASSSGSIIERLEYINDKMHQIQDWPGRGWAASSSGNASTSLTREACDAADNWEWFEDANGDGDYIDPEDGICVLATTTVSTSWGGTETDDNTYIADYTCAGSFPSGYVASGGAAAEGCALCVADCYDGRKDLPDNGGYAADTSCDGSYEDCYEGPITAEVLKNWKGTRLPTFTDFYGFCGSKDSSNAGTSLYQTGCDSDTAFGVYGHQVGRTDECMDLTGTSYEWLSEQHAVNFVRIAGDIACSYVFLGHGYNDNRFRAVFRP